MLRLFKLTLVLAFISVQSSAQNTINIDFKNKATEVILGTDDDIHEGEYYTLKIKNINLNLYNILLNSTDTLLSKPLQTPTLGSLEMDVLTKAISGISPLSTAIGLSEYLMITESFLPESDTNYFVSDPINEEQNRTIGNLRLWNEERENIVKRIDAIKLEIYKIRLNALKADNPIPKSGYDYDAILLEFENIRTDLTNLQKKVSGGKQSYEKFSDEKKSEFSDENEKADKQVKSAFDKFVAAITEIKSFINADKVHEFLAALVFIENNSESTFISLPIQFRNDQSIINLTITPRDDKYLLQKYSTKIVFPQNKSYFGTGISLYFSWLYDEAYSTKKIPLNDSQSVYEIVPEEFSKNEMGMLALFRFGGKFSANSLFGGHFSFGPGVSISDKLKPRVAIGGGLSFGNKHLVSLDAGILAGFIDKLSNAVNTTERYKEKPENLTVSKLKGAFYFSLGYNYKF